MKYVPLHIQLFWVLIKKRKMTIKKIFNYFLGYVGYLMRVKNAFWSPVLINFELWNECNESCLFCRSSDGLIYRGDSDGGHVEKGRADFGNVTKIIEAFEENLIFGVPYINGEPLISNLLIESLKFLNERHIGSIIASNGISLTERKSKALLDVNLDLLKVHISGMSNVVHNIEHRQGKVSSILRNLARFQVLNEKAGSPTVVMLDYILYEHNKHEVDQCRKFCSEHNILFNLRPGNNAFLEDTEPSNAFLFDTESKICQYAWNTLALDWNGDVVPCCEFVIFPDTRPLYNISRDRSRDVQAAWKIGDSARFRKDLRDHGRSQFSPCKDCKKVSLGFKF